MEIEHLSIDFNITNFTVDTAQINGEVPIVKIGDDQMRFQLSGFDFKLQFDYEFISDPPVFADIGTASLAIERMTFAADLQTSMDEAFSIKLLELGLNFDKPGSFLDIEGISDFGIVLNNTINTFISIFRNRLCSMINEQLFTEKFSTIANSILALVPNDIEILNTDFYI